MFIANLCCGLNSVLKFLILGIGEQCRRVEYDVGEYIITGDDMINKLG